MRQEGKFRYLLVRGLASGAVVAGVLIAVDWINTGTVTLTVKAALAFAIFGLSGAIGACSYWDRLERSYPDLPAKQRPGNGGLER